MLVFYYCIGKKQHILASLRKAEQNIFVPSGLATGVFEELPYLDFSADVFGVGSDVDALAKQVNENAAGRCTYFDDSSDRISTDFANHSVKRAAKFRELKTLTSQPKHTQPLSYIFSER